MSTLPTLLIKGNLFPPNGDMSLKKELDEWVPVEYIMNWFKERLSKTGVENRVLVLKSETASGKSTAIPPELYKNFIRGSDSKAGIICTQPRVLTSIENVNEMLKIPSYAKILKLGDTIGWSTKYNKLRPKSVGLLSATIGTLAQELKTSTDEEIMEKYRFILIDETHERDLQTDMTIYMLKNLLRRSATNAKCPFVVLMSATFDPQSFLDYFNVAVATNHIWCKGAPASIEEMWDWNQGRTVNNYTQAAATVVEEIVRKNPDDDPAAGDILIFLPGAAEFTMTKYWLVKLNKKLAEEGAKVFSLLQIDSVAVSTRNIDYMRTLVIPVQDHIVHINGKDYVPSRRVIMSTNVAETGLTLSNLKYSIDAGFNREIEYNPIYNIRGLLTKPAPQSRIRQRRGRVGRKFPGVFYPLYPKYIHERLPELQYPQILIEDISLIMMDIIVEQLKVKRIAGDRDPQFVVSDIDMIDPPTPDAVMSCLEKLYNLGYISLKAPPYDADLHAFISAPEDDAPRFSITKLGALAATFTMLTPETTRMILAAYSWGCSVLDVITIGAYLLIESKSFSAMPDTVSDNPKRLLINWLQVYKDGLPGAIITSKDILYKIRLLMADDFIHGVILFNAVKYIASQSSAKKSANKLQKWCTQCNISHKACLDLIKVRDDIIEQMLAAGFEIFAGEENALSKATSDTFVDTITRLKYCIYDGYRGNLLTKDGQNYKTSTNLTVATPKLFHEDERKVAEKSEYKFVLGVAPDVLIFHELSLKYNRVSSMYDVITDRVSAMDGFVSVDTDFAV